MIESEDTTIFVCPHCGWPLVIPKGEPLPEHCPNPKCGMLVYQAVIQDGPTQPEK